MKKKQHKHNCYNHPYRDWPYLYKLRSIETLRTSNYRRRVRFVRPKNGDTAFSSSKLGIVFPFARSPGNCITAVVILLLYNDEKQHHTHFIFAYEIVLQPTFFFGCCCCWNLGKQSPPLIHTSDHSLLSSDCTVSFDRSITHSGRPIVIQQLNSQFRRLVESAVEPSLLQLSMIPHSICIKRCDRLLTACLLVYSAAGATCMFGLQLQLAQLLCRTTCCFDMFDDVQHARIGRPMHTVDKVHRSVDSCFSIVLWRHIAPFHDRPANDKSAYSQHTYALGVLATRREGWGGVGGEERWSYTVWAGWDVKKTNNSGSTLNSRAEWGSESTRLTLLLLLLLSLLLLLCMNQLAIWFGFPTSQQVRSCGVGEERIGCTSVGWVGYWSIRNDSETNW